MINTHGRNNLVIVDSDALIGLISENDLLHKRCIKVADYLAKNNYVTIICNSTVLESATTLSRAINRPDLSKKLLKDFDLIKQQEFADVGAMSLVSDMFNPKSSKKNTPFDYYVCAVAKINNINLIFSFDKFYEKQGLVLVESIMQPK